MISIVANSQSFNIRGTVPANSLYKKIKIYRYHDPFNQTFIAETSVVDNRFFFNIQSSEPDSYFISSPDVLGGFIFILDEDINITLDNFISKSTILNSKSNSELHLFWQSIEEKYFTKLRAIEDTINLNLYTLTKIEDLKSERDSLFEFAKLYMPKTIFEYVERNPDSFVSLYLLTRTGTEVIHEGFYDALHSLNPYLKLHSRAKPYLK